MRPNRWNRNRWQLPGWPEGCPAGSCGVSHPDHSEAAPLYRGLRLVKLTLGIVATALTIARLLGLL